VRGAVPEISDGYSFWYACPPEGGKLYIPGYTGSLVCPAAADFCRFETISGVLFPEQNRTYEAIFWGAVGLLVVFAGLFCSCPCLRNPILLFFKGCCGVRLFELPIVRDKDGNRPEPLPLKPCPSRTLLAINGVTLLGGIGIVAGCSYVINSGVTSSMFSLLVIGCFIAMLGSIGVKASSAVSDHGPSCWLLTYFLADVVLIVLLSWAVTYTFAFSSWRNVVSSQFDRISAIMGGAGRLCTNCTRADAIVALETVVRANAVGVAGAMTALGLMLLTALGAAGTMIEIKTLASILVTFSNHVFMCFGLLMIVVGGYLASNKAVSSAPELIALPVVAGVFFAVMAGAGHVGTRRRSVQTLYGFAALQLVLGALAVACAVVCFASRARVLAALDKLSDDDVGNIATTLGSTMSGAQVIDNIQAYLNQLGLAFAALFMLQLVLAGATFLVIRFLRAGAASDYDSAPPPVPVAPILIGRPKKAAGVVIRTES
jgi:hypothetical protein